MLGLQRNIVFFRVNLASVAEKSWLACATVSGAVALAWKCSRAARAVELMVPGCSRYFFSSLMMLCYCVLHVLRHFVDWNCCIEEMCSFLELLEFEGCLARQLRFHLFNCWNVKEASHDRLFSPLQLLEFEGSIARKLRCHMRTVFWQQTLFNFGIGDFLF